MGKQKIVIQMRMKDQKSRSKVQQTVVKHYGVTAVKIEGADLDQVVIEGEGLDVVAITQALRGKNHGKEAKVLTVEPVKEKKKDEKKEEAGDEASKFVVPPYYPYMPYGRYSYEIPYEQPSCSLM